MPNSAPEEETHITRTVLGGEDLAIEMRIGVNSFVKRKVPMQFVPNIISWPCFVLEPSGGFMIPALLKRTWSFCSWARN